MIRPPPLLAVAVLCTLLSCGCASHENLPAVAWHDPHDAVNILARRAEAVRTVTAQGQITLTRPGGESVRLDLAMVRAGSDRVRIRAWKLGQAVFDLTMNPDGVWLLTPENASFSAKARSAGLTARKLAEHLALLGGDLFRRKDLEIRELPSVLEITSPPDSDGLRIRCGVERRTLVPRRYTLLDRDDRARFGMDLSGYRMIGEIPFACRYLAVSDDGRILIALREVELNGELAENAFTPPRRAEKLP